MKIYHVYILLCSDGTYYTGLTNNLDRRISEHKYGTDINSYTFSRRPVSLVYTAQFTYILKAIAFEKKIKKWSQKKKRLLIDGKINKFRDF